MPMCHVSVFNAIHPMPYHHSTTDSWLLAALDQCPSPPICSKPVTLVDFCWLLFESMLTVFELPPKLSRSKRVRTLLR